MGRRARLSYAEKFEYFICRILLVYDIEEHISMSILRIRNIKSALQPDARYCKIQITNIRLGYLCRHSELHAMPITKTPNFPQSSSTCPSDDNIPQGVLPLVGCLSNRRVVGLLQYCFPALTEVLRYPFRPPTGSFEVDLSP